MNIPFVLRSATAFAKARFSGAVSFDAADARKIVLCPAETEQLRPAIVLDGAFERLGNFVEGNERERMKLSFTGGEATHLPTVAYTFKNARLAAGSFLSNGFRLRIRSPRQSGFPKVIAKLDKVALCTGNTGDQYFGHCLNEDLPQMLLGDDFGTPARLPTKNWPDLHAYQELFELDWTQLDAAEMKEATLFWDFAQNSSRRERFLKLRDRLRKNITATNAGSRFYLRRGSAGEARAPDNDDDICKALSARGYDIIDVSHHDSKKFIAQMLDRKIIASVEGSHLMHLVYTLKIGGGALTLMPPLRPRCAIKDACDAIGAQFGVVVGHVSDSGYYIDIDEMNQTLDRLEKKVSNLQNV